MYKKMKINYDNNLSEEKKTEINILEINNTQKKIDKIYDILNKDIKSNNEDKKEDLDLSDFKFIIGDTILYQDKERVIEEALDEQLKISVDINMKNINKNGNNNDKKETWIDIDNPTIEIKKLKGK
jgi:phenylalanyl-tRNA synthetase alpha subunit